MCNHLWTELIYFHDPAMIRCLKQWVRRNISGLRLALDLHQESIQPEYLNTKKWLTEQGELIKRHLN